MLIVKIIKEFNFTIFGNIRKFQQNKKKIFILLVSTYSRFLIMIFCLF